MTLSSSGRLKVGGRLSGGSGNTPDGFKLPKSQFKVNNVGHLPRVHTESSDSDIFGNHLFELSSDDCAHLLLQAEF